MRVVVWSDMVGDGWLLLGASAGLGGFFCKCYENEATLVVYVLAPEIKLESELIMCLGGFLVVTTGCVARG